MYFGSRFGSMARSQLQSMRIVWPAFTATGFASS